MDGLDLSTLSLNGSKESCEQVRSKKPDLYDEANDSASGCNKDSSLDHDRRLSQVSQFSVCSDRWDLGFDQWDLTMNKRDSDGDSRNDASRTSEMSNDSEKLMVVKSPGLDLGIKEIDDNVNVLSLGLAQQNHSTVDDSDVNDENIVDFSLNNNVGDDLSNLKLDLASMDLSDVNLDLSKIIVNVNSDETTDLSEVKMDVSELEMAEKDDDVGYDDDDDEEEDDDEDEDDEGDEETGEDTEEEGDDSDHDEDDDKSGVQFELSDIEDDLMFDGKTLEVIPKVENYPETSEADLNTAKNNTNDNLTNNPVEVKSDVLNVKSELADNKSEVSDNCSKLNLSFDWSFLEVEYDQNLVREELVAKKNGKD